jgi:hypothetical protein
MKNQDVNDTAAEKSSDAEHDYREEQELTSKRMLEAYREGRLGAYYYRDGWFK